MPYRLFLYGSTAQTGTAPALGYINLAVSKFDCEYRATRREELTGLLLANGCGEAEWKFPEETGFYQPIVIAKYNKR